MNCAVEFVKFHLNRNMPIFTWFYCVFFVCMVMYVRNTEITYAIFAIPILAPKLYSPPPQEMSENRKQPPVYEVAAARASKCKL